MKGEERTRIEWAELFPEPYRTTILEEINKIPKRQQLKTFSREDFLPYAFVWRNVNPPIPTPLSNHNFWYDVSEKIERGEIQLKERERERDPVEYILAEINKEIGL